MGWLSRIFSLLLLALTASAAEWQWSAPMEKGHAFLWIPPRCEQVHAVIVGQNNMIEEGILEHAQMRATLAELGIAEVFITPVFDPVFQFDRGAGERFDEMMRNLAAESGYAELVSAPVIPIGHSACASYPWNFAAWNPRRTLAILSVKGDAPQTDLTGSGKPNPDWGERNIDGIPALMVMSEYEWWDARLAPALKFRAAHPQAPLALFADVGHGHFDALDSLVDFLARFIRKAAAARLAGIKPVDTAEGWLVDRWRSDEPLRPSPAPFSEYKGERAEAFWIFDDEMAHAIERAYATSRRKTIQQVDFVQNGTLAPISSTHAGVELRFSPENDGVTFRLSGEFIEPLPPKPRLATKDKPPPVTTVTPKIAASGAHAAGPVRLSRITGPVTQIDEASFRVAFNRAAPGPDARSRSIWLLAMHPGDERYKGAVQQAVLNLPRHVSGETPKITFEKIPDQTVGAKRVVLKATSDRAATPIGFYVREGPAELDGDALRFTAIPPRTKFPVKVTVVAWQFGRDAGPPLRDAEPVEQTFLITR